MTTEAQIAANRVNAQRSTGPKSPSGKRKSSKNALRHGLSAKALVAMSETVEDFEDFRAAMRASLQPQDAVEEQLFERVVLSAWRLRRVSRAEATVLQRQSQYWRARHGGERLRDHEGGVFLGADGLDKLAKLEAALEHSFERALALLEHRQWKRRREDDAEAERRRSCVPQDIHRQAFPHYDDGLPSKHLSDCPEEVRARWGREDAEEDAADEEEGS